MECTVHLIKKKKKKKNPNGLYRRPSGHRSPKQLKRLDASDQVMSHVPNPLKASTKVTAHR